MKTRILLTTLFLVCVSLTLSAIENPSKNKSKNLNKDIIIENLMNGLNSENEGLKTSSSYFLGEFKSGTAVIPLMKILKSDANEEARIMAALSLTKIGDLRGIFAVKQAIKYDSSERVRKVCYGFYQDYLSKSES